MDNAQALVLICNLLLDYWVVLFVSVFSFGISLMLQLKYVVVTMLDFIPLLVIFLTQRSIKVLIHKAKQKGTGSWYGTGKCAPWSVYYL